MTQLEPDSSDCESHSSTTQTSKPLSLTSTKFPYRKVRVHTIPGAHGFAFHIKEGLHFRVEDLEGMQVIDLMAWSAPYSASTTCEHFSASYTRYNLGSAAPPAVGECLYSNHDRAMLEIVEDAVKVHDMQFMACNPGFYARLGKPEHRSCASNVAEAMNEFLDQSKGEHAGFEWYQVHDPFNIFQNTPYYTLKKGGINTSRPRDSIVFRAKMDCVVALSACPFVEEGFNGGKSTDVAVVWEVDDDDD